MESYPFGKFWGFLTPIKICYRLHPHSIFLRQTTLFGPSYVFLRHPIRVRRVRRKADIFSRIERLTNVLFHTYLGTTTGSVAITICTLRDCAKFYDDPCTSIMHEGIKSMALTRLAIAAYSRRVITPRKILRHCEPLICFTCLTQNIYPGLIYRLLL
jgi:hypothetical protein